MPADHPPDPDDGVPDPGRRPDPRLQRRYGVRPTLIDWLAPADLIVHEATALAQSAVHTPYEALVALPAAIRDKIRLIHYPDDFDLAASVIEPLPQGRIYTV